MSWVSSPAQSVEKGYHASSSSRTSSVQVLASTPEAALVLLHVARSAPVFTAEVRVKVGRAMSRGTWKLASTRVPTPVLLQQFNHLKQR